jgi:hypothetical protein
MMFASLILSLALTTPFARDVGDYVVKAGADWPLKGVLCHPHSNPFIVKIGRLERQRESR